MTQEQLLKEQNHNENTNTPGHLIKRTPLTGTPFTQIELNGKYFLTIKNYKVTEEFDSEEDLNNYMVTCMWDLVGRTSVTLYTISKEIDDEMEANFQAYLKTPGGDTYDENKNYIVEDKKYHDHTEGNTK